MLGYMGFMVKNCGVEIKETAMGGVRGTVTFLLIKIDVIARGLGGKVIAIGDKARNLVEKIQDTGDKVPNSLESESR